MDGRLRELGERLAAERAVSSERRLRYSAELRREVIAGAAAARAGGLAASVVAGQLGISVETLTRWAAFEHKPTGFRSVRLRADSDTATVTVVSPGGFRAEGLDVATAASLLRLLG